MEKINLFINLLKKKKFKGKNRSKRKRTIYVQLKFKRIVKEWIKCA